MKDRVKQFIRPLVRRFIKPPIERLFKLWWRLSETKRLQPDSTRGNTLGEARLNPVVKGEFPQPQAVIHTHRFAKVAGPRRKISLIYNYYKKESTLFRSLQSLQKQAWRLCSSSDIEIILVDDGTEEENILDQLPENVLYLWQRKHEYGICRAKNTGARVANGDYIVFLDPDIMVSTQYFDAMLEEFQRYGDRTIQCGYIEDYHFVGCPDPRIEFGVWERPNRPTRRFYQIAGGNLAISRSLYYETPGFDEDLIYGGVEDLLFGYHLSKLPDVSVLFNRNMQAWHMPHPPGGAHANPGKSWEVVRAKWPEFYDDYVVRGLR